MKTKRLEILENSLKKKEAEYERRIQQHMEDVHSANGQPLNDKRNGRATLKRWEEQERMIFQTKESIKKTENAIEKEKRKIINVESFSVPAPIQDLIDKGILTQWRRFPHIFFVKGVEKARIKYFEKTGLINAFYVKEIPNQEQYAIFRDVFNPLNRELAKLREKMSEIEVTQ